MAWFDTLKEQAAKIGMGVGAVTGKGFPRTLTVADIMSADVAVATGKFNKLGEFQIPAQQGYEWGYGSAAQPENQGYLYVSLKIAAGTQVEGKLRLVVSDANETKKVVIYEERTEVLRGSTTDKTQKVPLPRTGPRASEDDKLILELQPDSAVTVATTASTLLLPVTGYFLSRL